MQDQRTRDDKTVTIVVGVILCGLLMVLGLGALWLADVLGLPDRLGGGLWLAVQAVAVLAGVGYVWRHRRA
jgi:biotin transporter BioY